MNNFQIVEPPSSEAELKQIIAAALKMGDSEITSVEALAGLTNRNYKMKVRGQDYAVRIPGKGTEQYINRHDEMVNSEITSRLGINPELILFDEKTGLKIVQYIPNAETLNPETGKRKENLILIAAIFQKLHTSGETFNSRFDVFEKITEYETILANLKGNVFDGHEEVKQQVLELEADYKSLNVKLVPCHNDPLAENFVKNGEEKMYLIDWEYSGMNDPLWDIAAYIIEAELSPVAEKILVQEYFNGSITEEKNRLLLLNKIFLDFLWTIWALMKAAAGEDFTSYAFNRFNRSKQNLTEYRNLYK